MTPEEVSAAFAILARGSGPDGGGEGFDRMLEGRPVRQKIKVSKGRKGALPWLKAALERLVAYERSPDYYEATAHQNALVGEAKEHIEKALLALGEKTP